MVSWTVGEVGITLKLFAGPVAEVFRLVVGYCDTASSAHEKGGRR